MNIEKLVKPHLRDIMVYEPGKEEGGHAKLSSNENPASPHPHIVAAVTAALREANRYPSSGSPLLVEALANLHGVTPGEIVVGNGSNEILDLIVRAFVNPGENIVYPVPSFIVYGLVCKQCDLEGVAVPCRDYRLDLRAMRKAVNENTRMVFICNPNNPTSTYVTAAEVDEFLDGLPEDVFVAMDEAYYNYVDAADFPDALGLIRRRNTVVALRSFSKFHSLAGLRVGYAIADPVVVRTIHQIRQPFNVNRLAQAAGLAALECSQDLLPRAEETIRERKRVRDVLLDLGVQCPPSQANFVFVDLGSRKTDLFQELYRRGVVIRRLGQFGASSNTYRISIGTVEENNQLISGLREVLQRS